jgi:tetratricopeptide (TPR) repeat protein
VGFLALLKQAQGSTQDEVLAEYRQAGLYAELAERYLHFGRQSEALAVAQEHLTETFEITRFAEHLLQSDAQWRDQALVLIERRLTEAITAAETTPKDHMRPHTIDTYRRWLSEQYRLAGHVQQALAVEQARFQAHPDEATYRAVRAVAPADGQESKRWTELRAQLLQTLTQQRSWAALASIFVDEGEIKQALAALREAEQTLRVRTYGSGSSALSTLRVFLSRFERFFEVQSQLCNNSN